MKHTKDIEIDFYPDWRYDEPSIAQMRKDLDEAEKLGATHVSIDCYSSYDSCSLEINFICRREETDEEYASRIKAEEFDRERIKQHELAQLEALKKKYGL
jgi:hypothetical protein